MAKQNKPAIRFKEFTDAWEQRKFSDLYAPLVERNSDLLPYNKTLSVATMTYKTDGNGAADSSLANYKRLRTGDIAFEGHTSKSFRYGRFVLNDVGDGIMSPRFSALRPLAQMPTNFWKYYIHYEPIMRKILVASTKAGTMMNELVIDEFLKSSVLVPSIEEQTRIGSILKNIDNLITLHQRKYDKLQVLKKAMLEKMFPKNGSSVPEIRFKGFTDAWEQRKLGEVVKEVTRNDPTSEAPIMMITANNGFIEQSERYAFDNAGESLKKYILLQKGELAYNHGASKLRPFGSCFALTTAESARIPFVYHCFSAENQNAEFLSIELNGSEVESQLRKIVSSGARMDGLLNISFDEYSTVTVLLPDIKEQEHIADFFRNLDHLITLHQRELEKLQNIKKSMLEKMFV